MLVDPSPAELAAIARELPRATLQFHGHEPAELCRSTGLPFVKVVRASEAAAADPASLLRSLAETYSGGLLMLDSGTAQRPGGTGKTFPWSIAAQAAKTLDVVVSGGLTPKNVAACVREVRPYAVDARSGVETGGRAVLINSQRDAGENREALARVRGGDVRLLYVAPERFAAPGFVEALEGVPVGMFVVDEAHCVSQWGHDFRPDYFELPRAAQALGARQIFAATATATPRVAGDVIVRLGLRNVARVTTGFDRPNLSYLVVRSSND